MKYSARYACSQIALYEVCHSILYSFGKHIEAFSEFKTKYSPEYLNQLHSTILQAENLPDFHFIQGRSGENYKALVDALNESTMLWQKLKRYIKTAYSPEELPFRLEQAGALLYKKAVAKNWPSANALLLSAKNFLNSQSGFLSAKQNMPPSFPVVFNQKYLYFSKCLLNFQQSEREVKLVTDNKIAANNEIFAAISEICQDGQQIFRKDKVRKSLFILNRLLKKINSEEAHLSDISNQQESIYFLNSSKSTG